MKNNLRFKIFKHHFYIEYYIMVLDFVQFIRIKKTANIIFNKESRIIKRYLIVKN